MSTEEGMYPKYVAMRHSEIILHSVKPTYAVYYRTAGRWYIKAKFIKGELITFAGSFDHMNGITLTESNRANHAKDNQGY